MPKKHILATIIAAAAVLGTAACDPSGESPSQQRALVWGVHKLVRPIRTGDQVLERAAALARVAGTDSSIAWPDSLDDVTRREWREGVAERTEEAVMGTFVAGEAKFSVSYRSTDDVLFVQHINHRAEIPDYVAPGPEVHAGIGSEAAAAKATECVAALEDQGVIPKDEFVLVGELGAVRRGNESDGRWVESYIAEFVPEIDGLPLLASELVVLVDAETGACHSIKVALVEHERTKDADLVTSSDDALRVFRETLARQGGTGNGVSDGRVGYYLPRSELKGVYGPMWIDQYTDASGPGAAGRGRFLGMPLDNDPVVIDLLSPR